MAKATLKVGLLGYGKMGKTIDRLAEKAGVDIVWRVGRGGIAELNPEEVKKAEVVIEFSHPESGFANVMDCLKLGLPVVSGTTGWLDKMPEVAAFVHESKGTFLYASNFSVGVNLFFALNRKLAAMMAPWDSYSCSLSETHHVHKKDAPSGTAIHLAAGVIQEHPAYKEWHLHASPFNNEREHSLPITAFRDDEVPGTHDVVWASEVDEILIRHTAHSRDGFAAGALLAANWVYGKKGVFSMENLFNL